MADLPRQEPLLSIVLGTYNRRDRLIRCCEHTASNVRVPHEMIVVDGGSSDGTRQWLAMQEGPRFRVVLETQREGATRAYNKGFRAAQGRYVMWLNDDAYPLPGAVEAAIEMIERPDMTDVGMVAFYHNHDREWNRLDSIERDGTIYSVYNVRGTPYANFGLLRRELLERLGYLDERFYFCGWDPDLSLKVQREAGLAVLGCRRAIIYHEELIDERKTADMSIVQRDNNKLFEKWKLPDRFSYPDPGPYYRAMLRKRAAL